MTSMRRISRSLSRALRMRVVLIILAAMVVGDLWRLSRIDAEQHVHSTVGLQLRQWLGRVRSVHASPDFMMYDVMRSADGALYAERSWDMQSAAVAMLDGWTVMSRTAGWYAPVARTHTMSRQAGAIMLRPGPPITRAEEAQLLKEMIASDVRDVYIDRLTPAEIDAFIATGRHQYPGRVIWTGYLHNAGALVLWLAFFGAIGIRVRDEVLPGVRQAREEARRERGLCPKCCYDLAGLAAPVCPECGRESVPRADRPDGGDTGTVVPSSPPGERGVTSPTSPRHHSAASPAQG